MFWSPKNNKNCLVGTARQFPFCVYHFYFFKMRRSVFLNQNIALGVRMWLAVLHIKSDRNREKIKKRAWNFHRSCVLLFSLDLSTFFLKNICFSGDILRKLIFLLCFQVFIAQTSSKKVEFSRSRWHLIRAFEWCDFHWNRLSCHFVIYQKQGTLSILKIAILYAHR